jgi:hypothetical protein
MSQLWSIVAQNYARYGTPLRPNAETLEALAALAGNSDPLVVVLGGTPLFGELAQRVWFVDLSADALDMVPATPLHRTIRKNWIEAAEEYAQADLVVGDGSVNAVDSPEMAERLLRLLATSMKPGATLAMRVFVKHELPPDAFRESLTSALDRKQFSEVRFLVYGFVATADGRASAADVDSYIDDLECHLQVDRSICDAYKAAYFEWRGMPAGGTVTVNTKTYFPSRARIEAQFAAAGLGYSIVGAGTFPLAEFTPIYVATI